MEIIKQTEDQIIKLGFSTQDMVNRLYRKFPNIEKESDAWFNAIKERSDGRALFDSLVLLTFVGGFSHREAQPFAVKPEDVIKYATNKNYKPIMKG